MLLSCVTCAGSIKQVTAPLTFSLKGPETGLKCPTPCPSTLCFKRSTNVSSLSHTVCRRHCHRCASFKATQSKYTTETRFSVGVYYILPPYTAILPQHTSRLSQRQDNCHVSTCSLTAAQPWSLAAVAGNKSVNWFTLARIVSAAETLAGISGTDEQWQWQRRRDYLAPNPRP